MGLNTKKRVNPEKKRAEEWVLGVETKFKKWGNVCFLPVVGFFFPSEVSGVWDPLSKWH